MKWRTLLVRVLAGKLLSRRQGFIDFLCERAWIHDEWYTVWCLKRSGGKRMPVREQTRPYVCKRKNGHLRSNSRESSRCCQSFPDRSTAWRTAAAAVLPCTSWLLDRHALPLVVRFEHCSYQEACAWQ